jgi:DNA-binding transcriptional MerR regulator
MLNIPVTAMGAWGKDWHNAIGTANKVRDFEAKYGMSIEQIMQYMDETPAAPADQGQPGQAEPPPPTDPEDAPLTAKQLQELLDAREQKQAEAFQKQQARTESQRRTAAASEARSKWVSDQLATLGFKPDEKAGQMPEESLIAEEALHTILVKAMREAVPHFKQNDPDYFATMYRESVPSAEVRAKAIEQFNRLFGNFKQRFLSAAATGQSQLPEATLSDGAGGRPEPEAISELRGEARTKAILAQLEQMEAARGR